MADRSFHPHKGSLEIDIVSLFAKITIGASGAVSASEGKGFATIVRTSAGLYTCTLSDRYNKLMFADVNILHSTDSAETVGVSARINSEDVAGTTPTIAFQFYDTATGADADPASGALVYIRVDLRNSSVS